jgi:hypothetical protein
MTDNEITTKAKAGRTKWFIPHFLAAGVTPFRRNSETPHLLLQRPAHGKEEQISWIRTLLSEHEIEIRLDPKLIFYESLVHE